MPESMENDNNSDDSYGDISAGKNITHDISLFAYTNTLVNSGWFLLAFAVFVCDLFTLISMNRTKRVPFTIKIFTCASLFCDCTFLACIFIMIVIRSLPEVNHVFVAIITEIGRLSTALSWVSITSLLVERVFCFYMPNVYAKYSSDTKVIVYSTGVLTSVASTKLIVRYLVIPLYHDTQPTFVEQNGDAAINLVILGCCLATSLVCYIAIFRIVNRHVQQVTPLSNLSLRMHGIPREYTSTRAISVVFVVFLAIHLPLFLIYLYYNIKSKTIGIRYLSLVATFIMCVINPGLYAWRFKECRLMMLIALAKLFKVRSLEKKAEALRIDVYDIVVINDRM